MSDARLSRILETLRTSDVRDIAGARVTATIPLSERLLNEIIAVSLPPGGAIRSLTVHPQAENRVGVRVRLARPEFLPPVSATLTIERQPRFPDDPGLEFRVMGLAGLLALAVPVASLQAMLPPGVQLERDRLRVDLAVLLTRQGHGEFVGYLEDVRLGSESGRLVIDVTAAARPSG